MSRLLAAGCVALFLTGVSGCGARTAEANLKKQIDLMKEMKGGQANANNINEIDIDRAISALQQLVKLQEEFKKFPEAEQKAAREKYAKEIKEVGLDEDDKPDMADGGKDGADDDDADNMSDKPAKGKAAPKKASAVQSAPKTPSPAKEDAKYSEE